MAGFKSLPQVTVVRRKAPPAGAPPTIVPAESIEFDEEDRRILTEPLQPLPRPKPTILQPQKPQPATMPAARPRPAVPRPATVVVSPPPMLKPAPLPGRGSSRPRPPRSAPTTFRSEDNMSSSEQTERDNEVAQSQFLGPGSRERFLAEIETKGELVMRSDFYGDIRWRKTAPGKFVVEWLGKTSDIRTRITPAGHAWLAAKLCK